MAGYVPARTTYKLIFDQYDGLEVVANAGSIGQYMDIAKLADFDWKPEPPYTREQLESVEQLLEAFGSVLVRWNIELSRGKKVPATVEGLKSLEPGFAMSLVYAWMEAAEGGLPLAGSDGGDLDLPVEPLAS